MNAAPPKLPVTAVIPVKNEETRLGRCLERLGGFAEVIVIDSGSTDGTRRIAEDHGARVLDFEWDGYYPKKRNWYLLNHSPKNEWVLFLDADERLTDSFLEELRALLPDTGMNGFWLSYTNRFLGQWLRHGVPQRKLALFRVGKGLYERIDENGWTALDMEVHEHPLVPPPIGTIAAPIEHDDDRGLTAFLRKHLEYAQWEAARFAQVRAAGSLRGGTLTGRQSFKYRHMHRWWYPYAYFVNAYILRLGFLDGAAGFHYAMMKAWYFNTIRLLIREGEPR